MAATLSKASFRHWVEMYEKGATIFSPLQSPAALLAKQQTTATCGLGAPTLKVSKHDCFLCNAMHMLNDLQEVVAGDSKAVHHFKLALNGHLLLLCRMPLYVSTVLAGR